MGADGPAENTPNASKHFSTKCLLQAHKLEIFEKKLSLGVPSPCSTLYFLIIFIPNFGLSTSTLLTIHKHLEVFEIASTY